MNAEGAAALIRWMAVTVWYWIVSMGYVVRPYDMLSDRRRWFWQPRTRCGVQVCLCPLPPPWVMYDANGYRRWCGACRGELVGHG